MSPGSKNREAVRGLGGLAGRESCLRARAKIIQSVRSFFIGRGYLEVETPNLIRSPTPEIHIDAVSADDGFMHTSPELCMKRMLSAGYSKIFQVCKCYRNGERGNRHLPEFTLLEWYRSGADYKDLMDECEVLIFHVARDLELGDKIDYMGRTVELKGPWMRISVHEAFGLFSTVDVEEAIAGDNFDDIMISNIEPMLYQPSFLYDYPASLASLARLKENDPNLAERFELYIGGMELANAFSELTDVHEQEERFIGDRNARKALGKKEYPFPDGFIRDLEEMPASAGIAFGIDRLVMLLTGKTRIDDVVSFTPEEV